VAHAARTIKVHETARLHRIGRPGPTLYEAGTASGTLPGPVTAQLKLALVFVKGTVTLYPHGGGSLTISVLGTPHSLGSVTKFTGTVAVRSGTGRYAHSSGRGTFTARVNRKTFAATVVASAPLRLAH
jgi:hypothetical protein